MTICKLPSRMANSEYQRQERADGRDDKHLYGPRLQVVQERFRNHFFLRLSLRSLLISFNSSLLMFLFSTRWTSSGLADPLKTRFTKSCTILPTTSRWGCAGLYTYARSSALFFKCPFCSRMPIIVMTV